MADRESRQLTLVEMEKDQDYLRIMLLKWGYSLLNLEGLMSKDANDGLRVQSITVRNPKEPGGDYLVVVKATVENRYYVGFHGAQTVAEALAGATARISNRSMKFREDNPISK
jgi:hypothetical protein